MTNDYSREFRGILLVSLFIVVVPLVFFPRDFGLRFAFSLSLLFALELGWYLLVLFVTFSKEAAPKGFLFALLTFAYRVCLGIGFGILLLVMFSLSLSSSLSLGIYGYTPAFLLQALMSPFALKSIFAILINRTRRVKSEEELEMVQARSVRSVTEPALSHRRPEVEEESGGGRPVSFEKETKGRAENKLENILRYLKEYAGVKAAVLVDHQGLVVAQAASDFDPETVACFARCFKEVNDGMLRKMGEKPSERIGIHTPDVWMCLSQIGSFTLVVLSDRRTDELLSVRISQSTGMIKKFLTERYQENVLKAVEV